MRRLFFPYDFFHDPFHHRRHGTLESKREIAQSAPAVLWRKPAGRIAELNQL
jgi:hypothetical protein